MTNIIDKNGKKVVNVFWSPPPNVVDSDMLKKFIIPQHDWKKFPTIILDDRIVYCMFL